jgi:hypothetical protein
VRAAGIVTTLPDGSDRQSLGALGHVSGLKHSTSLPGGDDQVSFTLYPLRAGRPPAIRVGRLLTISLAGGPVWRGRLIEPTPSGGAWSVAATGWGTFGALWQAYYTGKYDGDGPVDEAISRGLPWVNGGITASGIDATQVPDPAQPTIADHMAAITDPMTKTWQVDLQGVVRTAALPTAPTRLLVLEEPAGRSVTEIIDRLWIKYETTKAGVYATTSVVTQPAIDDFGTTERFADFSDAGSMSAATAQSRGAKLLARYTAAGWSGSFATTRGRYLTITGAEVDPAAERAGEVARMIFAGPSSEAEWAAGIPPTVVVGGTEYDWDNEVLTLTALDSVRRSLTDLLTAAARTKYK